MRRAKTKTLSESSTHGIIVSGEASESEEEELYDINFKEESFTNTDSKEYRTLQAKIPSLNHQTIHHQKLYKANVSLYKRFNSEIRDPLTFNTDRISKLRTRLGSMYLQTSLSSQALEQSKNNIEELLRNILSIDCHLLPVKSS